MKKDISLKLNDIIQILAREIKWCIENPDPAFHPEYSKGFQNGLIQAKYLISELSELREKSRDEN